MGSRGLKKAHGGQETQWSAKKLIRIQRRSYEILEETLGGSKRVQNEAKGVYSGLKGQRCKKGFKRARSVQGESRMDQGE